MYTNPQCQWNSQAATFYGNQWYTCTHTETMYDVCAHSRLLTSATLVLDLLEKKEERKMMNNFPWAAITHFKISDTPQVHFGSFKGCYQCGYYCKECLYSQISLKAWGSGEKWRFCWDYLLDAIIAWLVSRSWHSCKLLCKRSLSTHNSSY